MPRRVWVWAALLVVSEALLRTTPSRLLAEGAKGHLSVADDDLTMLSTQQYKSSDDDMSMKKAKWSVLLSLHPPTVLGVTCPCVCCFRRVKPDPTPRPTKVIASAPTPLSPELPPPTLQPTPSPTETPTAFPTSHPTPPPTHAKGDSCRLYGCHEHSKARHA